jgi:opacity protein-like surface antigen
MKTHLVCLTALFCVLNTYSQTNKGSIMLGGSVGYNSSTNKTTNSVSSSSDRSNSYRTVSFNPSIGYFIMNNFVVGLNIDLNQNRTVYDYRQSSPPIAKQTYTDKSTGLGLFATKYFMLNTTFGFYAGINAGTGQSKKKQTTTNMSGSETSTDSKGSSMYARINAGVTYFPAKHISLQAGIGNIGWNSSTTDDNNNKYTYSGFNAGISAITLQFGLYYFFGK